MSLKDFKIKHEDDTHYHVVHPSGKGFKLHKQSLDEKAKRHVEGMQRFAEGGTVEIPGSEEEKKKVSDGFKGALGFKDGGEIPSVASEDAQLEKDLAKEVPGNVPGETLEAPASMPQSPMPPVVEEPPTPMSSTTAMPIPGESPEVDRTPAAAPAPVDPVQAAAQAQTKALEDEKAATQDKGDAAQIQSIESENVYKDLEQKEAKLKSQEQIVADNKAASDAQLQAYRDSKIDPDHYWNSQSTGSKVTAGIGMLLSGFGGGASKQANMAADLIKQAIDRDVDAQKNEQGKQMNLYKMNREALGDDLAANLATQNQLYTSTKYKLERAASRAAGSSAQANAQIGIAAIDKQIADNSLKMSMLYPTHESTGGAPSGSEQAYQNHAKGLQLYFPEQYKESQKRYIPGIGVASVDPSEKDKESILKFKDFKSLVNEARLLQKTAFGNAGAWSPTNRAKATTLQNLLTTTMNDLTGLNRLTHEESVMYGNAIGKIGSINAGGVEAGLDEISKVADKREANLHKQLGIKPFSSAAAATDSKPPAPKAGQVVDGYTFKGGNPADPQNWTK